jgi:hypothetical protein
MGENIRRKTMAKRKEEEGEVADSFEGLADDVSPDYSMEESDPIDELIEETLLVEEILEEEAEEEVEEEVEEDFVVEYDSSGKIVIPERSHAWGDNVRVVEGDWAERILNDVSSRLHGLYDVVAFQGHRRQNRFLAVLGAQMLKRGTEDSPGGVIFVPRELEDYAPLQEMEKLDDAPEGFVAFRVK